MARLTVLTCLAVGPLLASGGQIEFRRDIRPIFSDKCFACHGPDAATRKTKLRFDIESSARAVIVPGHPEQSAIIRRISSDNTSVRMPPAYMGREKLKPEQIELIRDWIAQGAKWESFWSFIPPKRAALPAVREAAAVRNPIDNFVLARLEREGLQLSPEADRRILIRRVSLDLTGLPPTPAEVEAFLARFLAGGVREGRGPAARLAALRRAHGVPLDGSGALRRQQRLPDRRRARHVAVARLGDRRVQPQHAVRPVHRRATRGRPAARRHARSANRDRLQSQSPHHRAKAESSRKSIASSTLPTARRPPRTVWLGLTAGCARCHDHKYDPISQKDFYRLFAYFNQIPNEHGFVWNYGPEEPFVKAPLPEQQKQAWRSWIERIADRRSQVLRTAAAAAEAEQAVGTHRVAPLADWTPSPTISFFRSGENLALTGSISRFNGDAAEFGYLQPFTYSAWIKPAAAERRAFSRGSTITWRARATDCT